jgi:ssDNA-binding Zn-finger/Zn-ribbon topoisomerase 1
LDADVTEKRGRGEIETECCLECGSLMTLHTGGEGRHFFGCTKYPKCKGTRHPSAELLEQLAEAGVVTGFEKRNRQEEVLPGDEQTGPLFDALIVVEDAKGGKEPTGKMCPQCGRPLVLKFNHKSGNEFVGCSGFRKGCTYIHTREGDTGQPV